MKVLIISDTPRDGWAIGKLSDVIIRNNPQMDIRFLAVHPREVAAHIDEVKEAIKGVDLIHFQYWRTTQQLFEAIPELKKYKTMQTHHNQKNTLSVEWKELKIDWHITHTVKNKKKLTDAGYNNVSIIQHGIDLDYFTYNEDYGKEEYVGYVGRVVPWKGLKEIAQATRENGLKVLAMGKMDKPSYWDEISMEDKTIIDFLYNDVPDDDRINAYREMMCFIQNSGDNHEEGTLPLLEAMACGVPVISTLSGEATDLINDGENGLIVPFNNKEALKVKIKLLKEDTKLREKLRINAWQTVKSLTEGKMAREYSKIYLKLQFGEDTVSVITPTHKGLDNLKAIFLALKDQTVKIAEWIIVDDLANWDGYAPRTETEIWAEELKADFDIKYLNTKNKGYGLAQARNMGIIEARGKYLLLLDNRILPSPTAIEHFLKTHKRLELSLCKYWLFGDKGGNKSSFVENFSFIKRSDLIKAGMFNERIDRYGGMSQEVRERWQAQGNQTSYVILAKAIQGSGTHLTNERRADIIAMKLKLYKMGV